MSISAQVIQVDVRYSVLHHSLTLTAATAGILCVTCAALQVTAHLLRARWCWGVDWLGKNHYKYWKCTSDVAKLPTLSLSVYQCTSLQRQRSAHYVSLFVFTPVSVNNGCRDEKNITPDSLRHIGLAILSFLVVSHWNCCNQNFQFYSLLQHYRYHHHKL